MLGSFGSFDDEDNVHLPQRKRTKFHEHMPTTVNNTKNTPTKKPQLQL